MSKTRKKKRGMWIDITLISGILGLIGIILFVILTNDQTEILETKATALDTIDSTKTEAESAFPGIHIISETSNEKEIPFAIQYPQIADESFNLYIKDYISSAKQSYIQSLLAKEGRPKNQNKELNIYFDTFQYDDTYYSFVFTKRQAVTNGDIQTSIYTVFYNIDTQEILDMRTLLGDDQENLETFANHVRSLLTSDELLKDVLITEKAEIATEAAWDLFDKFSIFKDELCIYFNEGTVAPKTQGPVTVSVPMSFLNPLLVADFQLEMIEVAAPVQEIDYNRKIVALTFDDGPHPQVTPQILDILERYNAQATFYVLGSRVTNSPEIAKEALARGHEIGNHTWNHPVLPKLTAAQIMNEFNTTEQIIIETTGQESTSFRPPYGSTNEVINEMIPREIVIWSIDTLDWQHRNANALLANVQNQMHNHAIILMHDIHQSTADGLIPLLDYLSSEGYEFVTVSEILQYHQ